MSEMWSENYDQERRILVDELDTAFEAAALGYLNDENQMPDGLYGELYTDQQDGIIRLNFANWHSKSRLVLEKISNTADDNYKLSLFSDEEKRVSFIVYIYDLMCKSIGSTDAQELSGIVDFLKIEVYEDGRLSLMYLGTPYPEAIEQDEEYLEQDQDVEDDASDEQETIHTNDGTYLLGVDYSEEGFEMHNQIRNLIRSELGIDFWKEGFSQSLERSLDGFAQFCSEEDN